MKTTELEQPELIMMVGPPGSGKDTWIRQHMSKNTDKNYYVVSSDDIIEELGAPEGLSYQEAYSKYMSYAMQIMSRRAAEAIKAKRNIIWNQTNMSVKSRRSKLSQVPKDYRKIVVVFSLMDNELQRRLKKRHTETGKFISDRVVNDMLSRFQMPSKAEGFEKVIVVRQ